MTYNVFSGTLNSTQSINPCTQAPKSYALQWVIHSAKTAPSHESICTLTLVPWVHPS